METSYFGLRIHTHNKFRYLLEDDIKLLPFYSFWLESHKGSNTPVINDKVGINLHDWERFCQVFIKTGKHRYSV